MIEYLIKRVKEKEVVKGETIIPGTAKENLRKVKSSPLGIARKPKAERWKRFIGWQWDQAKLSAT